MTGRPATPPADTTRTSDDPEAIADDIRETRAELDETIGAIGAKLNPSHLVDEAKDALTSSARDAGSSVMDQIKNSSVLDTIKDNPLPTMAVGLSVAWFLSKVGESESDRYRHERHLATGDPYYAPRYGRRYGYDPYYGGVEPDRYRGYAGTYPTSDGGSGESMMDKAKDKASDLGDRVSDLADDATDAVSGSADAARDRARGVGRQLQRYERRAESWLDRQMQENPLAVGAVALAAGALVGLSVPETDAEHRAFGDEAEAARRRLASAAEDASERVTSAARDVADEAADKAKKVGSEAKSEAKSVARDAEDRAKDVADEAKPSGSTGKGASKAKTSPTTGKGSAGTATASASKTSTATNPSGKAKTSDKKTGPSS